MTSPTFLQDGDAGFAGGGFQGNIAIFRQSATVIYTQLRGALVTADISLAAAAWKLLDSVEGGARTSLNSARSALEKLQPNGVLTQRVLSGEVGADQWQALADVVKESIRYTMEAVDASMPTIARLERELLQPTVTTILREVENLPEELKTASPFIVVGLIIAGVVVLLIALR